MLLSALERALQEDVSWALTPLQRYMEVELWIEISLFAVLLPDPRIESLACLRSSRE